MHGWLTGARPDGGGVTGDGGFGLGNDTVPVVYDAEAPMCPAEVRGGPVTMSDDEWLV